MAIFENFPYTNFHELNLDWIITKVKEYVQKTDEAEINYQALKTYVESYFDNLDIQKEVDNKLDEMAESGELADIIAQYISGKGLTVYDTTADLKSVENVSEGNAMMRLGNRSYDDGMQAVYKVRSFTVGDVIDDIKLLGLNNFPTLVAELVPNNNIAYATPEGYGAVGDGVSDDTAALSKAISENDNVIGKGTYRISSPIALSGYNRHLILNSIIVGADVNGVTLEGSSNIVIIGSLTKEGTRSNTAFRLFKDDDLLPTKITAHNSIQIGNIEGFNVAIQLDANDDINGVQYNDIKFNLIRHSNYGIRMLCQGTTTWVNSNTITGGRVGEDVAYGIYMDAGNTSGREFDGNIFNCIGLEGITDTAFYLQNASRNMFNNIRFAESFTGTYALMFDNSYMNEFNGDIVLPMSQISSSNSFPANIGNLRKNIINAKLITNRPDGSWLSNGLEEFNGKIVLIDATPNIGFINPGSNRDLQNEQFTKNNSLILITSNDTYTLPDTFGNLIDEFYIESFSNNAPTFIYKDSSSLLPASSFSGYEYGSFFRCYRVPNRGWKAEKLN